MVHTRLIAMKKFPRPVFLDVFSQIRACNKTFVANVTRKRSLAGVTQNVRHKVRLLNESFPALVALVASIVDVNSFVLSKSRWRRETRVTFLTLMRLIPGNFGWSVNKFDVVIKLTLLDEFLLTIFHMASVRPLSGVNELVFCQGWLWDACQATRFTHKLKINGSTVKLLFLWL